jgi:chromosome segregation protein
MLLTQLRLFGFKSFADSHVINFNSGLTAIVGPNGCGKSNIIDAIRWVLGEQRTKILRSEKMEDVIFSGTIKRKPLNLCEVTLTLENNDQTLPVEYGTVSVTRRMFRTGESEYLINKKLVRLKDIHSLFYDTGMGIGSYSLMEQKMIDRILSEKDEERRTMFEEAAGINKYRNQRKEALKNLLKTGDDLQRISDIVSEKDRTVKMLARHVVKAQKFREYKDELTRIEVAFCGRIFRELSGQIKETSHQHASQRAEKEKLDAEHSLLQTIIEEKELLASKKEERLIESGKEVERLTEEVHGLEKSALSLKEKIEGAHLAIKQIDVYQNKLSETIAKSKEDYAGIERQLIELATQEQEAEAAYLSARREFDQFEVEVAEKRLDLNKAQQSKINLMEEEGELKSKLEKIKSISDNLQENRFNIEHGLADEKLHMQTCGDRISQCREILKGADEEHGNLSASRDALVAKIDGEENRYREILEQEKNLEALLISDEKKLEFFEEMNKNHEGYKDAVRSVIEKGVSGIRGIVADILDVPSEVVVPVESALGSRVQYVLAHSEDAARAAIAFLQEGKLGKASFAVESLLQGRCRPETLGAVESLPGVVGWAEKFVACKEGFAPLVSHLLGDVLIIEDPAVVAQVRQLAGDFTVHCVTRGGDTYTTHGIIRGGEGAHEEMGLLSRSKLIEALRRNLEKYRVDLEGKEREKASALQTLEEAKKALFEIDERLNSGRRTRQEHEGNIRHLDEEIMRLRARENETLEQIRAMDRRIEGQLEEAKLCDCAIQQLDERRTENEGQVLVLTEESTALEEGRGAIAEKRRNAELRFNALKQEAANLKKDHRKAETSMNEAHAALLSGRDERTKYEAEIQAHVQEIARLEAGKEESLIVRREKEQNLDRHRENYGEVRKETSELRQTAREKEKGIAGLQEKVHDSEMQLERLNEKRRSMVERLWEEYEKDLNTLTDEEIQLDLDEAAAREKIDVLKKRLKTIGPNVNLSVLEDYEQEKTSFDDLSKQKTDLEEAKGSLEKLIRKLDKEASEKFVETFKQVRDNFREVFITLFEGGEADIRLEDDPDPLNARIAVYARPSGKSMKNISLLSGGERALTATSLLFGLYLVKRSPYCILDEVDGPLDDANIGRFINLIRRFSEKTQFLVITHNKKTMAACDLLYGVTLIEPGVSQTVSVSLASAEDEKKVDALIGVGVN